MCAECEVALVEKLPEKKEVIPEDIVELTSTFNQADIAMIKSLLTRFNIQYFIFDEYFNLVRPMVQPVRFLVQRSDLKEAKKVLKEMNIRYLGGERLERLL